MAAPSPWVHGVGLQVEGLGVLLRGAPGVGKSTLALELLGRGHRLIADDVVQLDAAADGAPLLRPARPPLAGFLHSRALGWIEVPRLFGAAALAAEAPLGLLLCLTADPAATADPLPWPGPLPAERVLVTGLGHNLALLVELAVRLEQLRRAGHDPAADFAHRQAQALATRS